MLNKDTILFQLSLSSAETKQTAHAITKNMLIHWQKYHIFKPITFKKCCVRVPVGDRLRAGLCAGSAPRPNVTPAHNHAEASKGHSWSVNVQMSSFPKVSKFVPQKSGTHMCQRGDN